MLAAILMGAFTIVLVLFAGWFIANCVSEMDNDGMDRRESERGDIYGGKK
jgi:hypothetical protein